MNKDLERIAQYAIKCNEWKEYALSRNNKKLWRKWNKRLSRTFDRLSMNVPLTKIDQKEELSEVKRTWIIHGSLSQEDAEKISSKLEEKNSRV